MKTAIIGGGKGARGLIDLARGDSLRQLTLDIRCVVDLDLDAPGMRYARELGIMTTEDIGKALAIPGLKLIIELTGRDDVLDEIYWYLPPGVKLVDHTFARVFWDLIEARKEQEKQLQKEIELEKRIEKERHFLQQLFDTIPDLVIVLDRDRHIQRVNQRFLDYLGIEEEEALGRKCHQVLDSTSLSHGCGSRGCQFDYVFSSGEPLVHVRHSPEPQEAYWQVTQTPLLTPEGELEAVLGTWTKITEQVKLKREVEVQEQRFRSFIQSAQDMISIKDLEGRYLITNEATATAFEMRPEEFAGRLPSEILPRELGEVIEKHDKAVVETGKPQSFNETIIIKEREHHLDTIRFPLLDHQRNVVGTCTIARDVTKERELQDELLKTGKLAAVGKLAAGVAHEINNPLTGVLAFAEDIRDEFEEGSDLHDDMGVIIRETLRCRDIVKNLLDFSRQDKPDFERQNINDIVGEAIHLVERLPRFRNITFETDFDQKLPDILCDSKQIQQVLLNLMINAVDAMKGNGLIRLATTYHMRRDRCELRVEDDGPGVPDEMMDKVFEPFFSTKGTSGLGLAVIWGIVERHSGSIEVGESDKGGASFRINLPIRRDR